MRATYIQISPHAIDRAHCGGIPEEGISWLLCMDRLSNIRTRRIGWRVPLPVASFNAW